MRQTSLQSGPEADPRFTGKRILVAGGTGFIGAPLCRTLIASGAAVTVVTRDPAKAEQLGGTTCISDITALGPDDAFDIVICLTGETLGQRWTTKAKAKIEASRFVTIDRLVAYMMQAKKRPEAFLCASAIGWYGLHESAVFDEESHQSEAAGGDYCRFICEQVEKRAARAKALGIRTVFLRTGIVLGREGGALARMLPPFQLGLGGPIGNGRQWFSWIHLEDEIRLILHAAATETIHGPLNLTAPEPVTNGDFSRQLGRALKRPALLPVPGFMLRLIFGQMAEEVLLAGQCVQPAKALNNGFTFRYPSLKASLTALFSR